MREQFCNYAISLRLKNLGFEIRYRYDFVWESWENKNFIK